MERTTMRTVACSLLVAASACAQQAGPAPSAPAGKSVSSITVTSRSFTRNGQIPVDLTCDGKDLSPQLTWSSPPEGTKALVLVVDDPDASLGVFTHWLVLDLPPTEVSLAEGIDPTTLGGAKVAQNDFHNVRYNGPCPPHGDLHRYQFQLFAVDYVLPLGEASTRADVDEALSGHVLGVGTLVGLFGH
jgi:Raf kinase inhibitor-like YbhB/YbcL family protein